MKNLILLNRLGFNPNLTTRQSRVDSVSNPCRCRVLATLLLCLTLFIGSGNVWATEYELVTSTSGLVAGANYIIGTAQSSSAYFMSTETRSNNRGRTTNSATITNSKVTAPADALVLQLGGSTGAWTFLTTNYTSNGYLKNADSGTSNYCQVSNTQRTFTVTFSSNAAVITATSGSARNLLRYNSSNNPPIFACYGSGQNAIYLFKEVTGGDPTPTLTTSSSMTTLTYSNGSPVAQSFTIGGSNLTNTVTVTAPDDYEVCKTANGTYASSVSFTNTEVNAADKTVYIRLQSGLSAGNIASRNITVASSGADDKTIAVTGSVPYTITWSANGSTFATTYVAVGSTLALPADPNPGTYSCAGKYFYGWYGAGSSYSSESVAPSIAANGDAVSADKTYYAVFADRSGSGEVTWDKVTSAPSDWSGDYVIVASNSANAMISDFYNGSSGEFKSASVTLNAAGTQITSTPTDKMIWTFAKNGSDAQYSLKNKSTGTYAKITGTSSTNAALDASAVWFTIASSGTDGVWKVNSVLYSARCFSWYSSNSSFRTYANSSNNTGRLFKKSGDGYTWSNYATSCCSDPELAYGTTSVTKTYEDPAFTNTLTNSHSVSVTYALSSVSPAGCVSINASTGQVTINGAGSATVTASFAGNATYCADDASYTLTVNKANISPTLTYSPASVAVGDNSATPSVSGNTGSGTVTYAITSATPAGCATINASTGVVTGGAVGSVTVTATIGATTNYNGNTATATVNITAASDFPNNATVFVLGKSSNGGAWVDNACVKACFHAAGVYDPKQETYWIYDITEGGNAGNKMFAVVVPASGNFPYLDLYRYNSDCSYMWNSNGGASKAESGSSNMIQTVGGGTNDVSWYASPLELHLMGDPNNWASSLGTFSDQGAGVWEATYNNYAPANAAGESQAFKINDNYGGWFATNNGQNVTLDGMHVGSTYNITASYDIPSHTLTMSKTYVKGTVHFNMNGHGSAIADLTNVAAGSKIDAPSAPTAAGWRFGGWYKEAGCTNEWNFGSDVVNETMTLYAKWVQTFTVTYDANGGSSIMTDSNSPYDTGSTVTVKSNSFTAPTGKEFDHWNTAANNSGTSYNPSATFTISANTTLYAQWRNVNYTVTMEQSPAAGAMLTGGTTTANYGGTINISTNVPSGYRFNGWTASPSVTFANASATTTSFTMPAGNVTVTANFQQTHTVDWFVGGSAEGNKIGDDGQTTVVDHGGKIEDFPATTPDGSACDKVFVGWTNTSSYVHGTSPLFNDVAGSPTINADASFYAVYAEGGDITWTRVTSVSTVTDGGTFIIGYEADHTTNKGVIVPLRNNDGTATTSAQGILYSGTTSGSSTTGSITMSSLGNNGGDAYEVTIESGTTSGTISIKLANDNYIGKPTSGNNVKLYAANNTTQTDITPVLGDDDVFNLKMATDSALRYNTGGSQRFVRYYYTTGGGVVLYKKGGGATGHTITCTDCGSSVTPTYTAAPTGGTVSVTKSATPVASGSTVKTCTAVDLTVTLTPASHYTVTGLTATGVAGVTTTNVGNVYTVNIPADATGTLTLTPTFTEDAYRTIVFKSNGSALFNDGGIATTFDATNKWKQKVYLTGKPDWPTDLEVGQACDADSKAFRGWVADGQTWPGKEASVPVGSTLITDASNFAAAASGSGDVVYHAVWAEASGSGSPHYAKVTSTGDITNGDYLIVCETENVAFNGSLSTVDATSNYIDVTISDSKITANPTVNASKFTIDVTYKYIKSASNKYINKDKYENGLAGNDAATAVHSMSIDGSGNFVVQGTGTDGSAYVSLRYNAISDQKRFRFYKSGQEDVQLYKYDAGATYSNYLTTCCENYAVTLTGNGIVSGGTFEVSSSQPCVGSTVTLSATLCSGYTQGAWTVAKTGTPGTTVTVTNDEFTMPSYAVTVSLATTAKVDHFIDRMHATTDYTGEGASREGCNYTVPNMSNTSEPVGSNCDETHYIFVGWVDSDHVGSNGALLDGYNIISGNSVQNATGTTYYAIWAQAL